MGSIRGTACTPVVVNTPPPLKKNHSDGEVRGDGTFGQNFSQLKVGDGFKTWDEYFLDWLMFFF